MLQNFSENGVFETFYQAGALTYTIVIFVANIKVCFFLLIEPTLTAKCAFYNATPQVATMQYQWHVLNAVILFLSVASWFGIALAVSNLLAVDYNWFRLFDRLLGEDSFYLSLFFAVVLILLKDLTFLHVKNQFAPSNIQIFTEMYQSKDAQIITPDNRLKTAGTEVVLPQKTTGSTIRLRFDANDSL